MFVHEGRTHVLLRFGLAKPVHVQLSDEGRVSAMPEVMGQNSLLQGLHAHNAQDLSSPVPSYDMRVLVRNHDFLKLEKERRN